MIEDDSLFSATSTDNQTIVGSESEEDFELPTYRTVLPAARIQRSEKNAISRAVELRGSKGSQKANDVHLANLTCVDWPDISRDPVDEFESEGYFTRAFPTLFPTGVGEFLAPRQRSVRLGQYFKHSMRHYDGRFARHPRFRYFALNTMMRWRALETGRIYVRQNVGDAQISVRQLRTMASSDDDDWSLANRVIRFGRILHGTRQYWATQRANLRAMQETLGMPTVFFTLSAADLHWPELYDLLKYYKP